MAQFHMWGGSKESTNSALLQASIYLGREILEKNCPSLAGDRLVGASIIFVESEDSSLHRKLYRERRAARGCER